MTEKTHELTPVPDTAVASRGAAAAFFLITAAFMAILFQLVPPRGWDQVSASVVPFNPSAFSTLIYDACLAAMPRKSVV